MARTVILKFFFERKFAKLFMVYVVVTNIM
jgi:hypothetical protein